MASFFDDASASYDEPEQNYEQYDAEVEQDGYGLDGGEYMAPPPANGILDDEFVNGGAVLPPPSAMEPEDSLLLREWRQKRAQELEDKARLSYEKHEEIVANAKKDQEAFYKKREQTIEQAKINNREKEKIFSTNMESLNAKVGGNYWEAVTAFINFDTPTAGKTGKAKGKGNEPQRTSTMLADQKPGKHTDKSRMRQVLLKLKHSPPNRTA